MDNSKKSSPQLTSINCILEYVKINSVSIGIAQLGFHSSILKSFSPIISNSKSCKSCIIFIPAEVGNIEYYLNFLKNLYRNLNKKLKIPIIALGHAGHSSTKLTDENVYDRFLSKYKNANIFIPNSNKASILFNPNLFNLHGQVQSKLVFIRKFIPSDVQLYFVSHGIGSYISLQILNSFPNINTNQLIMIAPAMENIYNTKFGQNYLNQFKPYKFYFIDKLIFLYKFFALYLWYWLFNLLCLDKLVYYLFKKIFVKFFNQYDYVNAEIIPFLILLIDDFVSLVKDLNFNLMYYLRSKTRILYFANDDLSYDFFSKSNKKRFSIGTFLAKNYNDLANQTRSLIKNSYLNKKIKQNLIEDIDSIIKLKKDINLVHDFHLNKNLSVIISKFITVQILIKLNEPARPINLGEEETISSFESKNDSGIKSISKILDKKE